ncbi:MAG: TIGR01777 family protein [Bacteroidetes bacterium]|nr:TIGR01777 family protein [Bacteroidota bacterium]
MSTILISGGTGLVGTHLSRMLQASHHTVLHLSRRQDLNAEFPAYAWDLDQKTIDQQAVDRADCIVNLAGAGIADQRWTPARKRLLIGSRVDSTLLLKAAIERRPTPLRAFVSASAIGYYGNRGEELLSENDLPGTGSFLAETVTQWEQAVGEIAATGQRTVVIRIGIVLSTQGGALEKILLPFRFFSGAYFGNGQMWMSWIHIDDLCRMFIEAVENEQLSGTYNGVPPHPARNRDLVFSVKTALGKPAVILPAPEFALRTVMGEMADMLFDSTRVSSQKTEAAGFTFQFPDLLPALRDLLRRKI